MKIGFLGAGNMAGAILRGMLKKGIEAQYYISRRNQEELNKMARELDVIATSNEKLIRECDYVFIGVEPSQVCPILTENAKYWNDNKVLISMAAGKTINQIESALGVKSKVVRIMPNTPVQVGEGMISVSKNSNTTPEEAEKIVKMLSAVGKAVLIDEGLINTVIGISGSSPAYTFIYIEALIQKGIEGGLTREEATLLASQSVIGSAKTILQSESSPLELADMVCSPGGATIEAVNYLNEHSFIDLIKDGAQKAIDKAEAMSEE